MKKALRLATEGREIFMKRITTLSDHPDSILAVTAISDIEPVPVRSGRSSRAEPPGRSWTSRLHGRPRRAPENRSPDGSTSEAAVKRTGLKSRRAAGPDGPDATVIGDTFKAKPKP